MIDTDNLIAIEYADADLDRCIVQVFTKVTYAHDLMIYPILDKSATYSFGEQTLSGKDAMEEGILLEDLQNNYCVKYDFRKVK